MLIVQLSMALLSVIWMFIVVRIYADKSTKDKTRNNLYILPLFGILLLLTVLRHESVGVDYVTYSSINNILAENTWGAMWNIEYIQMEPLLLIAMKTLSYLNAGILPFVLLTTLGVLTAYYKEIMHDSKMVWMSVLLLVSYASFFTIFNTTSQMFVSVMVFAFSIYVYEGKFKHYLLVIAIAALFHKTALFMLPMYFFLRYRPTTERAKKIYVLSILSILLIIAFAFDFIVNIGAAMFFPEYVGKFSTLPDSSFMAFLRFLPILMFVLYFRKKLDLDVMKERVWFNAIIVLTIVAFASVQFGLMQRFTYFLLPYVVLIVPLILSRISNMVSRNKVILTIVIYLLCYVVASNIMSTSDYKLLFSGVA